MNLPPGHRVFHYDRIDSTNSEARRLVEAGELGPVWIWSDEQTGGRGRLGHTWISEPGNLYVTFLFQTPAAEISAVQISFVAAIAVYEVASRLVSKSNYLLKWPNDVLKDGAKFCGLLSEIVASSPTRIALGCGINLAHSPAISSYPVTSLGSKFQPDGVLSELAFELAKWLKIWDDGKNFAAIREQWLKRSVQQGRDVTVNGIEGKFDGLAEDGALLVSMAGVIQKPIYAGEVRFAQIEEMRSQAR